MSSFQPIQLPSAPHAFNRIDNVLSVQGATSCVSEFVEEGKHIIRFMVEYWKCALLFVVIGFVLYSLYDKFVAKRAVATSPQQIIVVPQAAAPEKQQQPIIITTTATPSPTTAPAPAPAPAKK